MKKKRIKIVLLIALLAIITTSTCFAGTWVTETINTRVANTTYETTTHLNTRGMPGISIWVSAEPSIRKVQIELFVWDYVAKPVNQGGGWQFVVKQTTVKTFGYNQTGYMDMNYMSGLIVGDAKYKITVIQGGPSKFEGSCNFFEK